MGEIDLTDKYPTSKRPIDERAKLITEDHRRIARQFGREFFESIFRDKKVHLYGDGSEMRDLLFVDDLVRITTEFAFGELCGTYNVASGKSHSFQEILGILRKISGVDFDVLQSERSKPKVDQQFDTSKLLKAIPGFRFTELEEGIRRTVQDFKDCGLLEGQK